MRGRFFAIAAVLATSVAFAACGDDDEGGGGGGSADSGEAPRARSA